MYLCRYPIDTIVHITYNHSLLIIAIIITILYLIYYIICGYTTSIDNLCILTVYSLNNRSASRPPGQLDLERLEVELHPGNPVCYESHMKNHIYSML